MRRAVLFFMLLAATAAHAQLFDHLEYHDGVATLQINARLTSYYMYEPRGEYDTGIHEFPASAVAFKYGGKEYLNVGFGDSLKLENIDFRDSVKMTIMVWRDRIGAHGTSPYAEVIAITRLRAEGEVDTIGRAIGYGDTLYITHLDGRWEWKHYITSCWGAEEDNRESYLVLHMSEAFCKKLKGKFYRRVDYYSRGNQMWYEHLPLKNLPASAPEPSNCDLWLQKKLYNYTD